MEERSGEGIGESEKGGEVEIEGRERGGKGGERQGQRREGAQLVLAGTSELHMERPALCTVRPPL